MSAKIKKQIYGYTLAGTPITTKFEDYRGHVIADHQDKITIGRMGSRVFENYPIVTIEQAKKLIDVWEDNDSTNMGILSKLAAVFDRAAA